jgi:hypothetical protein
MVFYVLLTLYSYVIKCNASRRCLSRLFFELILFEQVRSTLRARSCSEEGEEERKGLTSFGAVDLQICFLGFHQSLQASVRLLR